MKYIFTLIFVLACALTKPESEYPKTIQLNQNVKLTITKKTFADEQKAKSVFLSNRLVQQSFYQKAANPYYANESERCIERLEISAPIEQLDSDRQTYSLLVTLDNNGNLVDCSETVLWAKKDLVLSKKDIFEYVFVSKNREDIQSLSFKTLK